MTEPLHASARRQPRAERIRARSAPHRLLVLGGDVPDLVTRAGGLICDSIRAGLSVQVCLESLDDDLALRILGADAAVLPDAVEADRWPDAIYFASELHERNRGVRRLVVDAARRHNAEVASWGGTQWLGTSSGFEVAHRLSSAARMFKLHALHALGRTIQVSSVEPFRSAARRTVDAVPYPCG